MKQPLEPYQNNEVQNLPKANNKIQHSTRLIFHQPLNLTHVILGSNQKAEQESQAHNPLIVVRKILKIKLLITNNRYNLPEWKNL